MSLTATPYVVSALQHSAQLFRQAMQNLIGGSGIVGSADLEVTKHEPANLSVEVAPGNILIPGTQGSTTGQRSNSSSQHSTYSSIPAAFTSQGVYAATAPSITNLTLAAADPTNARIDLIVATVQDAQYSGSFNQVVLTVVTGTPAGSPAAPTPPENSVVLAQVAVAAKATKIEAGQITNERPRAISLGGFVPSPYTVSTKVATATKAYESGEFSATELVAVVVKVVGVGTENFPLVEVGGVNISGSLSMPVAGDEATFTVLVPAGKKIKVNNAAGLNTVNVWTSVVTL